jgi:hypothetical protein
MTTAAEVGRGRLGRVWAGESWDRDNRPLPDTAEAAAPHSAQSR